MAINYFEDLGFGQDLRDSGTALAKGLMYQQQKQEQQAQQAKKEQQAALQFANEQQKLKAARAAGAFYNALQSGDDAAAIQILRENKAEVDSLGDPSFTTERIEPLLKTPEGRKQMMQSAAGLVQLAAGPDKFAQYVQAQQKPVEKATYDQPASIKELEYYQKLQRTNPEAAAKFARSRGYVDTPKEENRTEAQRNMAEYQRLQAQNPELAKQFGQSVGLVSKEGKELSAQTQKRLSEFTDAAIANGNLEQKYNTLANDFDKAGVSGGIQTSWTQWAREQTGNQDEVTELRKEFFKIRGSEVVNNLPPGAASDADIAMALSGFPGDKASGSQISSFLRGLAKLKAKERELNEFKANYVSENGTERGMLSAWKESQKQGKVIDWGDL